MSGFAAEWLALREPVDARARAASLLSALPLPRSGVLRVVDLGTGTGNNLRYLAPRLALPQHWTLVDRDSDLLEECSPPVIGHSLNLECRRIDLVRDNIPLDRCDLVTASAFVDLVSQDWLKGLAAQCALAHVSAGLFALTVDGRLAWRPREPEDDEIAMLFIAHMGGDKGFGPALGVAGARALAGAFTTAGYVARTADSAWRLSPGESELQRALLDGYVRAACERASPRKKRMIEDWASRRVAHLARGESWLKVGHADVLVTRKARND